MYSYTLGIIIVIALFVTGAFTEKKIVRRPQPMPIKPVVTKEMMISTVKAADPYFNELTENRKICGFLENYMWCVSSRKDNLSSLKKICTKPVITYIEYEIDSAKLVYNSVNITKLDFQKVENFGQDITISYTAEIDYSTGEKNTMFTAKYDVKYGFIIRQDGIGEMDALTCESCGAPVYDEKASTCSYCGAKVVRKAAQRSWAITQITRTDNRLKYMG